MAVNTYTISSANDLKAVLESHPPFNTDAYNFTIETESMSGMPRLVVKRSDTSARVCAFLFPDDGAYYNVDSFIFEASSTKGFGIKNCLRPKIAIATSKGVIVASNESPYLLDPTSNAGAYFFSALLGNDKNGKPAVACMTAPGVRNVGYLLTAALEETSSDIAINNLSTVIREPTSNLATLFPARTDQVMVTCPIATHPSTGTNTIDGGLLFIQCPVIPLGVVRIGNKNYATNGIMAISD